MAEFRDDGTIMRNLLKIYGSILAFSLLFGTFFVPFLVKANFLSSILGNSASADVVDSLSSTQNPKNSQTMALLQANVSFASLLQDKNSKDSQPVNPADTGTSANIVSGNALQSVGVSDGTDAIDSSCGDITVYKVADGNSISQVAKLLGVPESNVLAANNMKKELVKNGVLFISDTPGFEHTVASGETLKGLAKRYKADVNEIAFCNGIAPDAKIKTGTKLVISGGKMTDEGGDKPAPGLSSSLARDLNYYITNNIRELVNYFIYPLPIGVGRKTQGLHGPGHRGIDYGAPKGTPIYASAKGIISIVCRGWCGGYGTMAIIEHPDKDTKTLYAHMSKIAVQTDEEVTQGKIIGYVGSTGRSTGPHLHFEVFYFKNPGVDGSWAQ